VPAQDRLGLNPHDRGDSRGQAGSWGASSARSIPGSARGSCAGESRRRRASGAPSACPAASSSGVPAPRVCRIAGTSSPDGLSSQYAPRGERVDGCEVARFPTRGRLAHWTRSPVGYRRLPIQDRFFGALRVLCASAARRSLCSCSLPGPLALRVCPRPRVGLRIYSPGAQRPHPYPRPVRALRHQPQGWTAKRPMSSLRSTGGDPTPSNPSKTWAATPVPPRVAHKEMTKRLGVDPTTIRQLTLR
jgi:hypothetical protein